MGARHYYARNLANNSAFDNAYSVFLNTLSVGGEPTPEKPIRDFSEAELFFLQNAGFDDLINIPQGNFSDEVPSIVGDSLIVTGGGNGSRFDGSGLLVTGLPADRPRYTYDPLTGEYDGVYLEKEDTNKISYSCEYGNNSIYNKREVVITDNFGQSPEGIVNASKIARLDQFPSFKRNFSGNYSVGDYVTFSYFVKPITQDEFAFLLFDGTNRWVRYRISDLLTTGISGAYGKIEPSANGYFRIYYYLQLVNALQYFEVWANYYDASINNNEFLMYGLHSTLGFESESTFIKTDTTTVTRPADIYTATGAISGSSYGIFVRDQLGKRIDYYHDGNKYTYRNGSLESTVVESPSTDLVLSSFTGSDKVKTIALRLGTMTATELENITTL